jgi:TPR repeat protein
MTSNVKWGANTPLSSSPEERAYSNVGLREHDPNAKALLNRHLSSLRDGNAKQGNSALHELEAKLAELCRKDDLDDDTPASMSASTAAQPEFPAAAENRNLNLTDRLKELSAYLEEDLTKFEQPNSIEEQLEPAPIPQSFDELAAQGRSTHKSINSPILDRAWFEDRFAAMRASIDDIARKVPDERLDALGNQFNQLMEKLDLLEVGRSQAAVEDGLKKLASYLEENKHWNASHDNRIRGLEDRIDKLSGLVAQSNAALSATAKGLEIVARGTGPALANKTADLVAERLGPKLMRLDSGEKIAHLSGEVSTLSMESQSFARKTDERLKLLQTTLDDGIDRIDAISPAQPEPQIQYGWDEQIDTDISEEQFAGKMAAARRAAQLSSMQQHDMPQDGEPIRHQIPYGEFLPEDERKNSSMGLIVAAVILLLASAAMLYLNLRDKDSGNLLSLGGSHVTQSSKSKLAAAPVRIMLNQQSTAATPEKALPPKLENSAALVASTPDSSENLTQAAISGDTEAQFAIAETYLQVFGKESKLAAAERLSKAARWFRRAAENGHVQSQYRLATLYELGQGVDKDYSQAINWYRRAAENGHVKAMHNLAVLSISDSQPTANHDLAAFWFTKAAKLGLRDSQFNLAILYEHGLGVEKDSRKAYHWYAAAAKHGDVKAARKRDLIASTLPALPRSAALTPAKASGWSAVTTSVSVTNGKPLPNKSGSKPAALPASAARGRKTLSGRDVKLSRFDMSVEKAQILLRRLGYEPGEPDGILGPKTISAILAFEQNSGLPKTGRVSENLIVKMNGATSS